MMSEAATAPTVRMVLLAKRMKNFSPARAVAKFDTDPRLGQAEFIGDVLRLGLERGDGHEVDREEREQRGERSG